MGADGRERDILDVKAVADETVVATDAEDCRPRAFGSVVPFSVMTKLRPIDAAEVPTSCPRTAPPGNSFVWTFT